MRAWCRRPGLNWRPLRYECTALPLRHAGNEIHERPVRARPIEKSSLPETTVCRPTKGNQYRISGPSYVLAGTAILNRNHFKSSRDLTPAVVSRLNSVDVVEIDLLGLRLGYPAALRCDAHEGTRYRRGKNPLAVTVLESGGNVA